MGKDKEGERKSNDGQTVGRPEKEGKNASRRDCRQTWEFAGITGIMGYFGNSTVCILPSPVSLSTGSYWRLVLGGGNSPGRPLAARMWH